MSANSAGSTGIPGAGSVDVLILCGGMGKRLQSVVSDRPKPMASFGQHTFLDLLIDYVSGFGFRRFVLCAGYMKEKIVDYYTNRPDINNPNTNRPNANKLKSVESKLVEPKSIGHGSVEILCVGENIPLGTGGAVKNAESYITHDPFVVMNGDSFFAIDFNEFLRFHFQNGAEATIALKTQPDVSDFGTVEVDAENRIKSFIEKGARKSGLINGGIYLFNRSVLDAIIPSVEYSLEYNLFPSLIGREFYGYFGAGDFIDIGTPERLEQAKEILKR
ncbi:MAG: nucleotidyltransferase family protein [Nitrospirae bacterium]|nr:nucleotidyltransferase family protein [Nitrospirota bacterium]